MLGISRWSEEYSYKTIERFFDKKIDWLSLKWHLIKRVIGEEVILVADETTVSKAGKCTYGVGYFYSGLQGRAINGVQFLSFSLVDVKSRRAYPLFSKQLKNKKKKVEEKKVKGKVGRPKGSKNKNSSNVRLKGLFRVVNWYLQIVKKTLNLPQLRYFVYDGAFGNKSGIQATKRADLNLISKLKKNSSLYFKFTGEQKGRGRKRKYGELIDYQNMDKKYFKKTSTDKDIETKIYQFQALQKTINEPINVILIFSTNLKTKKTTHTLLFSTDLEQGYEKIIDYYSLRFQIEFNFRDAKQYFGLEDFMNIKKRRLHNFANLSLFMNNLSYLLYKDSYLSRYSINDIKSLFMAERYTRETLKFYGQKVDDILISKAINHIAQFSMIYRDSA
jgi:putative transposase